MWVLLGLPRFGGVTFPAGRGRQHRRRIASCSNGRHSINRNAQRHRYRGKSRSSRSPLVAKQASIGWLVAPFAAPSALSSRQSRYLRLRLMLRGRSAFGQTGKHLLASSLTGFEPNRALDDYVTTVYCLNFLTIVEL
jgi:hypothetical protein